MNRRYKVPNYVSTEGLDKVEVLSVLFKNSMCYGANEPHTEDILRQTVFSDTGFDPRPYDEAHRPGYAAEVIAQYRKTGRVQRFTL